MLTSNLRLTVRDLKRRPSFAVTVVLTLTLGIGATTAAFAFVKSVFFARLPVRDQAGVVVMWTFNRDVSTYPHWPLTWESRLLVTQHSRSFAAVTAYNDPHLMAARYGDRTVPIARALVAGNFFDVLGAQATAGRLLHPEDEVRGGPDIVVVSQSFWQHQLGADAGVIGRLLYLDGAPHWIVGVAPPEFSFPAGTDVWLPATRELFMEFPSGAVPADSLAWYLVGRLRPRITLSSARAEFNTFVQNYVASAPRWMALVARAPRAGVVEPYTDVVLGDEVRPAVAIAFASVLIVLIVACTNLAGLLLSRGIERAPELVVRAALGATARQLTAHLLSESAILGVAGGALGIGLSAILVRAVRKLAPQDLAVLATAHLDLVVWAFAGLVTAVCVAGFGLLPALRAAQSPSFEVLRGSTRSTGSRVDTVLRRTLVGAQVALTLVVLSDAGVLGRTIIDLQDTPLGFAAHHLLFFKISDMLPQATLQQDSAAVHARWNSLPDRLDQQLRGIPGLSDVTAALALPFSGSTQASASYVVDGRAPTPDAPWRLVALDEGVDDYFGVMGIPVLRGRRLTHDDNVHAPPVAVVSEAFANQTWPGQDPLGHRFRFRNDTAPNRWFTVVGVVGDTRYDEIAKPPTPRLYLPVVQTPDGVNWFVVRTRGEPATAVDAVTAAVRAADPDMAVSESETGPGLLRTRLARPRALAILFVALAATALLLAGVGLFGVLSAYVRERRREIAVRSALGATPQQLRALVLGQVFLVAAAGLACGVPLALGASHLLRRLVAEVRPIDAGVVALVGAFLLAVVTVATYGPMLRASRVDARTALATE